MAIELKFDVPANPDGIIDGRALAQALMAAAFKAVAPYVHGCPTCAVNLFSAIAAETVADLEEEARETGRLDAVMFRPGYGDDAEVFKRHFEKADPDTYKLLERWGYRHADHTQ